MIKKAYFHENSTDDNTKKAGSFYAKVSKYNLPKIQWILKEAYSDDPQDFISKNEYNNWWSWDNYYEDGAQGKSQRHTQKYLRLISYGLMMSSKERKCYLPSVYKDADKKQKGTNNGVFKKALRHTSLMNVRENPAGNNKNTSNKELKEIWNNNYKDVIETIEDADPEIVIVCLSNSFFDHTVIPLLGNRFNFNHLRSKGRCDLYSAKINGKDALFIRMNHPGQGFYWKDADNVVKGYCDVKSIPTPRECD